MSKKKVVIDVTNLQSECELCGYHHSVYGEVNGIEFNMGEYDFDAYSVQSVLEALGYEVEINEEWEYC